jgi:hypothetical protein
MAGYSCLLWVVTPYSLVGAYQQSEEHTPFIFRANREDQVDNTSDLHVQIPAGNLISHLVFSYFHGFSHYP